MHFQEVIDTHTVGNPVNPAYAILLALAAGGLASALLLAWVVG